MLFFYNIFIKLYSIIASLISFKNVKAAQWISGRKNIFAKLEKAFENNTNKVIWMHCASLGELEQGRPIIEKLKQQTPNYKILITFFSPSGYEVQKNYSGADWVFYLPIDTKKNAKHFYKIVKPTLSIFVKYEFWYHYITEAKVNNIPLLLVSGIFRKNQPFFKWYGGLHKKMLECFDFIFLQNQESLDLLKTIHPKNNIEVCGDTRFDRVIEIATKPKVFADIEKFIANYKVIVAGSTWTEDDEELDHFANTNPHIKFIIAPHNIESVRLTECLSLYKNSVLYSELNNKTINKNVLIIDNVGMLSSLYNYATIAYIGGGFGGDGVHNVLEAAVFGKPVIFGPEYEKFIEANELINFNGAISIDDALELEQTFDTLLKNEDELKNIGENAAKFVLQNGGATNKIIGYIYKNLLLTS